MFTLRRMVAASALPRVAVRTFSASEIPINQVVRVARCTVGGEADALELDDVARDVSKKFIADVDGAVTVRRSVCKTEWAYELEAVFENLDSLVAYLEGEQREQIMAPMKAKLEEKAVGEVYFGNRVHDDLLA